MNIPFQASMQSDRYDTQSALLSSEMQELVKKFAVLEEFMLIGNANLSNVCKIFLLRPLQWFASLNSILELALLNPYRPHTVCMRDDNICFNILQETVYKLHPLIIRVGEVTLIRYFIFKTLSLLNSIFRSFLGT